MRPRLRPPWAWPATTGPSPAPNRKCRASCAAAAPSCRAATRTTRRTPSDSAGVRSGTTWKRSSSPRSRPSPRNASCSCSRNRRVTLPRGSLAVCWAHRRPRCSWPASTARGRRRRSTAWSWRTPSPRCPRWPSTSRPSITAAIASRSGTSAASRRSAGSGATTAPRRRAWSGSWTAATEAAWRRRGRSSTPCCAARTCTTPACWSTPTSRTRRSPCRSRRSPRPWASTA
mmetsp:Transcript_35301/g.112319  ORF Transcript_35301/g.112319 Transcript_35301/m.112319 type:complete len:230 (-) Transcript_35301:194-883(-)